YALSSISLVLCFVFLSTMFTLNFLSFFFFYCYGDHRDLHSFPTRRSSDLQRSGASRALGRRQMAGLRGHRFEFGATLRASGAELDRKSTRLNSSHRTISYAVFCLKKKKKKKKQKNNHHKQHTNNHIDTNIP